MYLVIDLGNTNIKFGLYEERRLLGSWRTYATNEKTSDEYGIEVCSFLNHIHYKPEMIEGVIISSVRVALNYTMEHMCEIYFKLKPMFVSSDIITGLDILYDEPELLGADRIVNAVAAYEIYGGPCITVDFGTATTFGCISRSGQFLGGAICPGIQISTDALVKNAAKLPNIEFIKPDTVIRRDPISSMQAGIIYGFVGLVDAILDKMKAQMGGARVIATGGLSKIIAADSQHINVINSLLTLEGLSLLYLKNQNGKGDNQ